MIRAWGNLVLHHDIVLKEFFENIIVSSTMNTFDLQCTSEPKIVLHPLILYLCIITSFCHLNTCTSDWLARL